MKDAGLGAHGHRPGERRRAAPPRPPAAATSSPLLEINIAGRPGRAVQHHRRSRPGPLRGRRGGGDHQGDGRPGGQHHLRHRHRRAHGRRGARSRSSPPASTATRRRDTSSARHRRSPTRRVRAGRESRDYMRELDEQRAAAAVPVVARRGRSAQEQAAQAESRAAAATAGAVADGARTHASRRRRARRVRRPRRSRTSTSRPSCAAAADRPTRPAVRRRALRDPARLAVEGPRAHRCAARAGRDSIRGPARRRLQGRPGRAPAATRSRPASTVLGENRVQEAEAKVADAARRRHGTSWATSRATRPPGPRAVRRHRVGRLAGARRSGSIASSPESGRAERRLPVYLQVNVDADPAKAGFTPAAWRPTCDGLLALARARGARAHDRRACSVDEPEAARPTFVGLRASCPNACGRGVPTSGPGPLDGHDRRLRGGRGGGATLVRVGRAIFGERPSGLSGCADTLDPDALRPHLPEVLRDGHLAAGARSGAVELDRPDASGARSGASCTR